MAREITRSQAQEFYRDLCGTINGDSRKTCQGVASIGLIADVMRIPVEKANAFCSAMFRYGITERQGGGVVV